MSFFFLSNHKCTYTSLSFKFFPSFGARTVVRLDACLWYIIENVVEGVFFLEICAHLLRIAGDFLPWTGQLVHYQLCYSQTI